jgi:urease accessory protein
MNSLIKVLHLADSAYPTGSFAHSWGLEYAIYNDLVSNTDLLFEWCKNALIYSYAPLEGRSCIRSFEAALKNDFDEVFCLDFEVSAMRPSENMKTTSAQMGRSFVNITALSYGEERIVKLNEMIKESGLIGCIQHPVAWGTVFAWLGLSKEDSIITLLHGVVKQWIQVAVRIIPLGQSKAQKFLADFGDVILETARKELENNTSPLESISPMLDIASIGHESLKARYFIN